MKNNLKKLGGFLVSNKLAVLLAASLGACVGVTVLAAEPQAFTVSQSPLFLANPLPNVLLLLDNSNSFDEDPSGRPVGSNNKASKNVIGRSALRTIVNSYQGKINLGLMSYKLPVHDVVPAGLDPALYDASYDPSTYDATFTSSMAFANNWEAFPYTSWTGTPYTGTYGGPMTCSAPFSCPWSTFNAPGIFAGINWMVTPWPTTYQGERRGQMIQYTNLTNLTPWYLHPYDFIYYNLMQADYSNDPKNGRPQPQYCFSPDAMSLHGHAVGSPINPGGGGQKGGMNVVCFTSKTAQNAGLYPEGSINVRGVHVNPTYVNGNPPTGNFGSYGFANGSAFASAPTDSDYAQGFTTFGRNLVNMGNNASAAGFPAAPTWYSPSTDGVGDLWAPIQPLTNAYAATINSFLQCNIPATWPDGSAYTPPGNTVACTAGGIVNAGGTPSPGALQSVGRYFSGTLTNGENDSGVDTATVNTSGVAVGNLPNSCGKNYVIFLTDGMPTHKSDGSLYATPAAALADTVAAAAALKLSGTLVYVIGFGSEVEQNGLSQIAAAGGTSIAYLATDAATLNSALSVVFNDLIVRSASAASVATNSAQFSASTALFQARFTSADWSGQLLRYETSNTTGAVATLPAWDAAAVLMTQPWSSSGGTLHRNIITSKLPGTGDAAADAVGVPFTWPVSPATPLGSEINVWQSTSLNNDQGATTDSRGGLRVNWIRGDQSNESSSTFRARTDLLGDLVNSFPVYTGAPSPLIDGGATYRTFKSTYSARAPSVVVGGNDGIFHVFNGTTGAELLGFVPSSAYKSNPESGSTGGRLSQLMRQDYKNNHAYIVDGTPVVSEVNYASNWHTVAVSTSGAGGQDIFALNISNTTTDTSKPDPVLSEANAANILLWEFTDTNTNSGSLDVSGNPTGAVNGDSDLGYTIGKPYIGLANNGKWVAIFGNGYNNTDADGSASATGYAAFYVVDVSNGHLIKKISIPVGAVAIPNGLGTPRALDSSLSGHIDYAYAGDLYGNLWKFDLTSSDPTQWAIALSGQPLFTVNGIGGVGNRRPITGELRVAPDPVGGYRIMFGTGRYMATPSVDLPSSYNSTSLDSLYSIWDQSGLPIKNGRSWLTGQSLKNATTANGNVYRQLTSNASTQCSLGSDPSGQAGCSMGCYVDMKDYPSNGYDGERFTFFPQLSKGFVSFNTIIPSSSVCSAGGNTETVVFDFLTCKASTTPFFDVTGAGTFTSADLVNFSGGSPSVASSKLLTGITPPGTRVYNQGSGTTFVYNSSSAGGSPGLDKVKTPNPGGRVSHRVLNKNPPNNY